MIIKVNLKQLRRHTEQNIPIGSQTVIELIDHIEWLYKTQRIDLAISFLIGLGLGYVL